MANKNKISITALENAIKPELKNRLKTIEWNGLEIEVKTMISLKDMLTIVDSIVDNCFDDETGEYIPEIYDFALRDSMITVLTNITMPSSTEKQYEICYSTLFNAVLDVIGNDSYYHLIDVSEKKIDYINEINISSAKKDLQELVDAFEGIQIQLGGMFDGIGSDDLKNILAAVSKNGLDENKLMQAYLNSKEK